MTPSDPGQSDHDLTMVQLRQQLASLRETQAKIAALNARMTALIERRAREQQIAEERRKNSWWYKLAMIVAGAFTFGRSDK